MKVTIHQPNYFPWPGYFHKISLADTFVILDSVQYEKEGFTNRNKIRIPDSPAGWAWLTVPVKKGSSLNLIKDVEIDNNQKWRDTSFRTLKRVYAKAPYLQEYLPFLESIYGREWTSLSRLNIHIIMELIKYFRLNPDVILASSLEAEGKKSDLNLDICKKVGATTYVSGISGKDYLDVQKFNEAGILIEYQQYEQPRYKQICEPFIPFMSAIDLLLNYGPESMDIIRGKN